MLIRIRPLVALALLSGSGAVGCSTHVDSPARGRENDASLDGPERLPPIELTLWPVWDTSDSRDIQNFTMVDDAIVCVKKVRPIGKNLWTDFVDTEGPCVSNTTSRPPRDGVDRVVVIPGVPAMSELVVTAEKDGYQPSVFAVTTGATNQDVTGPRVSPFHTQLRRADSAWSHAPSVPVEPDTGDISLYLWGCVWVKCDFLRGATVTIENLAGGPPTADNQGPFYWAGGESIPGATTTVSGPLGLSGTTFLNLQEGEYVLRVQHPRATCRGAGVYWGDLDNGYISEHWNEVRAPVLAGHSTVWVQEVCFCNEALAHPGVELPRGDAGPLVPLEIGTCERLPTDGGAP